MPVGAGRIWSSAVPRAEKDEARHEPHHYRGHENPRSEGHPELDGADRAYRGQTVDSPEVDPRTNRYESAVLTGKGLT